MMSRQTQRLLAVTLAVGLVAASCGGSDSTEEAGEGDSVTTTTAADSETTEADDVSDGDATTTEAEADEPDVEEEAMEDEAPLPAGFPGITQTVQNFVDDRGLSGASLIIVHRDDGVIYEEYFGEFESGRISLIASSSKMISAGVLLKLAEDGVLDMDAPIAGQVDWTGNPDVTPAQLVSNSSGLVGLGPNLLYAPYLCQWGVSGTIEDCGKSIFTSAADDSDQVPPDTEFRYGGAQWQVAGAFASSASGKSWNQLIDEIYIQPCGVDSLGYLNYQALDTGAGGYPRGFDGNPDGIAPTDNPNIEGGGYISMADYATLLLMHLRGGECDGTTVLSQESLDTMHADRVATTYDGDAGRPNFGYGMGWWVDRETGRISDGGAFGTVPWLDLDDGYGAYIVIEQQSDTGQELKGEIEEMVHTAVLER